MEPRTSFVERVAAFASGVLAVVLLQAVYGWWLNSGRDVLRASLVLLVWSMVAAAWQGRSRRDRALAIWLGAISGSTGVLFWIGPGTIWPIVLSVAAAVAAGAVGAGTLLGASITSVRRS
jgi:hypothetical protein